MTHLRPLTRRSAPSSTCRNSALQRRPRHKSNMLRIRFLR
eukprot:CAMPEP_0181303640 /NCGR_PEP_ID=MMETSP1101-20121128/8674_1 /TAXON_ID=46948 /ORGANISM="Rhodomonas abbreviata, Strain Caron Lab Isolate" /LENGTH=39 /DNA_ID= /DNA_START= /DNA_END= /DNA_ORIENTATION=